MQAARVDPAHAAGDDHRPGGRAQHERVELLARLGGVLLGVVQAAQRAAVRQGQALEVEQHGGGDQRARERAAAGLVGAGHVAAAELPVEGEQAAPAAFDGALGDRGRAVAWRACAAAGGDCSLSALGDVPTWRR